jgi:uncharacterized membrane protein
MKEEHLVWLIIIGIFIVVSLVIIIILYFVNKKARDNGASWVQIFTGKDIGSLCSSDAMCKSNKCKNNLCYL